MLAELGLTLADSKVKGYKPLATDLTKPSPVLNAPPQGGTARLSGPGVGHTLIFHGPDQFQPINIWY